jgi:hypothetical protein
LNVLVRPRRATLGQRVPIADGAKRRFNRLRRRRLISNDACLAWAAVGAVLVVAAIGALMFAGWWKGGTLAAHTAVPADASFPLPIVIVHGLLGLTTLLLAALSAAGLPD